MYEAPRIKATLLVSHKHQIAHSKIEYAIAFEGYNVFEGIVVYDTAA